MCRPVNASKKQRNCHVKLMIVDDHVGIMGNGNQGAFLIELSGDSELRGFNA